MVSAHDVAAYILEKHGPMSTWKLQKLLYYSQGWHLAWDDEPLFPDRIEAWANGPVVRPVFAYHRRQYTVSEWPTGNSERLSESERGTVDAVLRGYGELTGRQLSILTHEERPWLDARQGLEPTERSENEITQGAMYDYFAALDQDAEAEPPEHLDWEDIDY